MFPKFDDPVVHSLVQSLEDCSGRQRCIVQRSVFSHQWQGEKLPVPTQRLICGNGYVDLSKVVMTLEGKGGALPFTRVHHGLQVVEAETAGGNLQLIQKSLTTGWWHTDELAT